LKGSYMIKNSYDDKNTPKKWICRHQVPSGLRSNIEKPVVSDFK